MVKIKEVVILFLSILVLVVSGSAQNIHEAARQGNLAEVKAFLETDKKLINFKNIWGKTPLHLASDSGHLEVVKFLTENGADLNAKDNFGRTPLNTAVVGNREEIVNFFIQTGE